MSESENLIKKLQRWLAKRRRPADRAAVVNLLREVHGEDALFDADTLNMMEGALRISQMRVADVMIPMPDVVALRVDYTYTKTLEVVNENHHSRYPVLDADGEKALGLWLAKDALRYVEKPEAFNLRETMRAAMFKPVTMPLNVLLQGFRRSRVHMAVAVDEYGLPAGVVTIEDVLERIVGDIDDEFDYDEDDNFVAHGGGFRIKGGAPLAEFYEKLNLPAAGEDEEAQTVSGWLAARFGHVPRPDEAHEEMGWRFEVAESTSRRILLVRATPLNAEDESEDAAQKAQDD